MQALGFPPHGCGRFGGNHFVAERGKPRSVPAAPGADVEYGRGGIRQQGTQPRMQRSGVDRLIQRHDRGRVFVVPARGHGPVRSCGWQDTTPLERGRSSRISYDIEVRGRMQRMGVLPEHWRKPQNGSPAEEARRTRQRHAALWRRHDRAMKRRRFLRRMKLPVLLPLGFIGLALALWGIEHWAPTGALRLMIAAATAERSPGPAADRNRQAPRATEFVGRVVGIADGDTFTVLMAERDEVRVRLAEIDAPEATQPFGARAKQVLSSLAFGRTARVSVVDTDRYGRTVARLYVGTLDVNAEMVRQGAAWVYVRYSRDPVLPDLEREAQRMRLGLWALPQAERMPPWEWRQLRRE